MIAKKQKALLGTWGFKMCVCVCVLFFHKTSLLIVLFIGTSFLFPVSPDLELLLGEENTMLESVTFGINHLLYLSLLVRTGQTS